jgi:type II secretory pathway pseudopilin PulG
MPVGEEARVRLNLYAEGYKSGLDEAARRTKEFEKSTGASMKKVANSTKDVADSHRLGAEQISKYGTATAALTGSMSKLPVAGDAISKSVAVVMDVMNGMAGAMGLVVVGIGAAVTALALLANKQKELQKATDDATDAIIRQEAARQGSGGNVAKDVSARRLEELKAERAKAQVDIDAFERARKDRGSGYYGPTSKILEGDNGVPRFVKVGMTPGLYKTIEDSAVRATKKVQDLNDEIATTQAALYGVMGPPESAKGGKVDKGTPGTFDLEEALKDKRQMIVGMGRLKPEKAITDAPVKAEEIDAYDALEEAARAAYSGIQAAGSAAYRVIAAEAQKATSLQKLAHLQLGRMYIQSIREGLAAYLDSKAQAAIADAAEYAYKAIASLAGGNFASAAFYGQAAALAGLQGGAFAIGASLVRGQAEAPVKVAGDEGTVGSGSYGSTAQGTTISSGGGAQTFVYNVTVVHQGAAVYGDGGIRDLWNRDFVPLLRDYLAFRTA